MPGGYNNFLDKIRAQNYASIRKSGSHNLTINGPNTFNCVKKKQIIEDECCNNDCNYEIYPCVTNYPCITYPSNDCCDEPCYQQACNCNKSCNCETVHLDGHTGHRGPIGPVGPTGSIGSVGPTGSIGATGDKGIPGTPSGLVLFLDQEQDTLMLSNYQRGISVSFVTSNIGSLLSVPTDNLCTLITYSFNDSYQAYTPVLISTFTTPANSLASVVVPGGVWELNVFSAVKYNTNDVKLFGKIYYVDSNGLNPEIIGDGSYTPVTIDTFNGSYTNQISVPIRTLPDTTYRIKLELYVYQSKTVTRQNAITIWVRNVMTNLYTTLYSATGSGGSGYVTSYTGATGPQGAIGNTGSAGIAGIGHTGPQGAIGNTGSIGHTGPAGIAGIGHTGHTGPAGIAGIGHTGPQGEVGPAGNGGSLYGYSTSTFFISFLYTVRSAAGSSDYIFSNFLTNLPLYANTATDSDNKFVVESTGNYLRIKNQNVTSIDSISDLMPISHSYIYASTQSASDTYVSDWATHPIYTTSNSNANSQVLFLNASNTYGGTIPNICIFHAYFINNNASLATGNNRLTLKGLGTDDVEYPLVYFYLTFLTSIC